jgi:hypothetical protein
MRLLMFISWGFLVIFLAVQLAWSVRTETEAKAADLVAMPYYRIYRIGPDNRIQSGHDVECLTEEQAKEAALEMIDPHSAAEIWHGTRLVARLPAQSASTASLWKFPVAGVQSLDRGQRPPRCHSLPKLLF